MRKFWQKRYISKYTGKEIDDAVAKAGTALQNPMTAAGDLIVGGADGAAERLGKGTDGKVLKMVSGAPAWADDSAGMSNPMTAAGDLIVGGEDGAAERLGKGTDGQVLSMVSGAPAWAAAGGGGGKYLHALNIALYDTTSNAYSIYDAFLYLVLDTSTPLTAQNFLSTFKTFGDISMPLTGCATIGDTTLSLGTTGLILTRITTSAMDHITRIFGYKFNVTWQTGNTSLDDYPPVTVTDTVIAL